MDERGDPVDCITLIDELERRGLLEDIGGWARVRELAALVPVFANARHYARIVARKARDRALLGELEPFVEAIRRGEFDEREAADTLERFGAILASGRRERHVG